MSDTETSLLTIRFFRGVTIVFAFLLGSLSVWLLAAEVARPPIVGFTADPQSAASAYRQRDAAIAAARIGLVRGDLWSEAAFAYGNRLWSLDENTLRAGGQPIEQTRALTELAITYAPYDSRLWLLLAANYFRFDSLSERASAALKMSYYTGLNTVKVIPERLLLATQSHALDDSEFQELVRHDIRVAVTRKSDLMPALITAYTSAPLSGRQFIEKSLAAIDPGLLASIRSQEKPR